MKEMKKAVATRKDYENVFVKLGAYAGKGCDVERTFPCGKNTR